MPMVRPAVVTTLDHLEKLVLAGKLKRATLDYYHYQFNHLINLQADDEEIAEVELSALRMHHLVWSPHTNAFFRAVAFLLNRFQVPLPPGFHIPHEGQRSRTLEDWECKLFWRHCTPTVRWITKVILLTGVRPEEARELNWLQVKEERELFEFREFKAQDARHDRMPIRNVPIGPELGRLFSFVRRKCRPQLLAPVFLNRRGNPWTCQTLRQAVRKAAARAGLDQPGIERITAYTFRHTYATRFLRESARRGMPNNEILLSQILGHTNLETTKRYCHPNPDDLGKARAAAFGSRAAIHTRRGEFQTCRSLDRPARLE